MMDMSEVNEAVVKRIAFKVLQVERTDGKNPQVKKGDIVKKIKRIIEEEVE
jgi:aryl-phospho-beta-D-glucosidase BglC (GH1 family)